jgi:hypothetical protein
MGQLEASREGRLGQRPYAANARRYLLESLAFFYSALPAESDHETHSSPGVVLLDLVEVLTGAPVQGPVCREPTRAVQRIMNVNFAIKRLRDTGKNLPPIPAEGTLACSLASVFPITADGTASTADVLISSSASL